MSHTAPEAAGSFHTQQPNQVTENVLVLGTSQLCWVLLHCPDWRLLVTMTGIWTGQLGQQSTRCTAEQEACGHLVCWWRLGLQRKC